ncbi:dihydrofolate reductase family protein [Nocardia stercoris]|uniref:Dihydrofolate reductase n=1 Tax=Nocardia stercoris TaxID=2483361 RepID=A0A3M2L0I6_9NOCA|nr:dihydrofolate reductase family protein [Nocardia stercoris]RMI31192.1 dihydrofolate reductase [Nocardia stercoris]
MRKVIAAFKISADGKYGGPDGYADWVESWPEDFGSWLTTQIDACVLGAEFYPLYEQYWSQVEAAPDEIHPFSGRMPTAEDVEWSGFAAKTPHYVVSKTLKSVTWPNTRILPDLDAVAAMKREPGKDIYLIGGPSIAGAAIDAGLVDELRLIVYPLIVGDGKPLFSSAARHAMQLHTIEQLPEGRLSMVYGIGQ